MPYRGVFEVRTTGLGTDGSETSDEEVTIHGADAHLGLYSDGSGILGSGIELGEVTGGVLSDKWAMVRTSGGSGSELRFTFGPNADQGVNPTKATIDSTGVVSAGSFMYREPDTMRFSVAGTTFQPEQIDPTTDWEGNAFVDHAAAKDIVTAPIHLPDGASVQGVGCSVNDVHASADLICRLCVTDDVTTVTSCGTVVTTASSSGSAGLGTFTASPLSPRLVNNLTESYRLRVQPIQGPANFEWKNAGHDLEIIRAYVTYTVPGPK
jgi:hypothetical protein